MALAQTRMVVDEQERGPGQGQATEPSSQEPPAHKIFSQPFGSEDDGARFLFICGDRLIQRRKLLDLLEKKLAVSLVDRDLSAHHAAGKVRPFNPGLSNQNEILFLLLIDVRS